MFFCQWKAQFYIGGQLENAVVSLTYGDYNGNYSLLENPVNSILNVNFVSVQFKIICLLCTTTSTLWASVY